MGTVVSLMSQLGMQSGVRSADTHNTMETHVSLQHSAHGLSMCQ